MIVYKYLHPDRTSVLEEGHIRFTQSTALNDPFETTPNMQRLKQSFREYALRQMRRPNSSVIDHIKAELLIKKHFDEFRRANTNNYAILSLSKTNNNLLMWAHYCDSHRGFVVGFDSLHPFFQTRRPNAFSALEEVSYSDQRPIMPAPNAWNGSREQVERVVGSEDLATLLFFTKSADWEYEQELRMIANPKIADLRKRTPNGLNIYLFKFPTECVREVIFGIRMPALDKRRLATLVEQVYPKAHLFNAELNEEQFDLNIVKFT